MRRRDFLAAAAGAAVVAASPASALAATRQRPGAAHAPDLHLGDFPVVAQVRARRALEHLRVLSDRIGPRIGGTDSEHQARDYLVRVLRQLRYQVTTQPFAVPDKYLADLVVDRTRWQAGASRFGALGVTVKAPVVDVGDGSALPDLTGKIALFVNAPTGSAPTLAAIEKGAVAVVLGRISATASKLSAFSPTLTQNVAVPVVGLAQVHTERLRGTTTELTITTTHHANLTSHNVIAERPPTFPWRDNGVVMITAHYDSVPGSPGANDDGSGTVLCLELARVLRHLPTNKTIRFALWGSEEQGLLGSRHYVSQLIPEEIARIKGVFQNDMVATSHDPATAYWLLSVDGADNNTTREVRAAAQRLGYDPRVHGPVARGSSDHVPFHEKGMASANFSWRGEGGPQLLEPIYHTPEDTIAANVSLDRLQVSIELIGAAAYRLATLR
ncbi:M28 family peptidase [Nocardia sp. NRRL S-836]|uniref:M28 family peptidase n=1 Tax=Nocardia sp. NRRL S-836 TaxID=1519492 RepID=UPI0006AF1CF2|nr:M28 family peptidase [Nocardia sp. NRRL S-836]KOV85184.1 peptidase M28 [Nocardia sp. NRRL S-836]